MRRVEVALTLTMMIVSLLPAALSTLGGGGAATGSGPVPLAALFSPPAVSDQARQSPDSSLGVLATIPVGSLPGASYVSADGYVYLINLDSNNVSILSGTSLVGTVWVGSGPEFVTYGNGYEYVVNLNSDNVSVLRGTSLVGTVNVGVFPNGAAFDSEDDDLYVTNALSSNVSVISGTDLLDTLYTGSLPQSAIYDSFNGYVYIGNEGSNTVTVLQGTTIEATINVGSEPYLGTDDPSNGFVYVINTNSSNVSVLSGTSLVGTIATGFSFFPETLFDPANGYVYEANDLSNNVSVLSGASLEGSVNVGDEPLWPVYDAASGYVYVSNPASNNVSVLSDASLVATVQVGSYPDTAVAGGSNGDVFVSNSNSSNVSVLTGTSLTGTIPVGSDPVSPAYDPDDGYVYVPNSNSNNVSVLGSLPSPQYRVSFTTDPASCGFISFNGTNYLDGASVSVLMGSYGVTATPCAGYSLESVTGTGGVSITASAANVTGNGSVVASFNPPPPAFTVTFGLNPAGCGSITFNGTSYLNGGSARVRSGSYAVSVAACAGYTLENVTGTGLVSIQGGTAKVNGPGGVLANFTSSSSSSSGILGLSGDEGYLILGGIAVIAITVIAGVLVARRRRPPVDSYVAPQDEEPPTSESR